MTLGAAGAAVGAVAQRHSRAEDLRGIATDTAVGAGLRDVVADGTKLHQRPENLDQRSKNLPPTFDDVTRARYKINTPERDDLRLV